MDEEQFLNNIKLKPETIGKVAVISNANNYIFIDQEYNYDKQNKKADFITIRPLDDSKYAIDLVVNFAKPRIRHFMFMEKEIILIIILSLKILRL